jgi:DNA-binding beta-propeller fold protein YncE
VSVIDMQTLKTTAEFAVSGGPDCMELTADGTQLWVTQRFAGRVAVLEMPSGKLLKSVRVGRSPHGIYFHNRAALV